MNVKKTVLVTAFISIAISMILYLPIMNQMAMHETVHAKICEYAGGNATIDYGFLRLSGYTHCDSFNENLTKEYYLLNSMNELYGYQFFPFLFIIIGALFSIVILIFPLMLDTRQKTEVYKPPIV